MPVFREGYVSVDNGGLESTNVLVATAAIFVGSLRSVAFTIAVITASVDWTVFGANQADYSDEVEVQAEAAVAAGNVASYAVAQAPYLYYRTKIKSTAPDTPGTASVIGVAK